PGSAPLYHRVDCSRTGGIDCVPDKNAPPGSRQVPVSPRGGGKGNALIQKGRGRPERSACHCSGPARETRGGSTRPRSFRPAPVIGWGFGSRHGRAAMTAEDILAQFGDCREDLLAAADALEEAGFAAEALRQRVL